jgi:hypothetical protein
MYVFHLSVANATTTNSYDLLETASAFITGPDTTSAWLLVLVPIPGRSSALA